MKLYEITNNYQHLQALDGLEAHEIADTLEALEGDFQIKAQSIVAVRAGMDADIKAIDAEITRLQDRKKSLQAKDASVRDYLKHNMQSSGITNIKCPLFSITLAKGRDVVVIDSEPSLPDKYVTVKTSVSPDKKAILSALKSGEVVPGAHLEKSSESLRIK